MLPLLDKRRLPLDDAAASKTAAQRVRYRMTLPLDETRPRLDDAAARPGNRIHGDDLATCCLAALLEEAPAGIYNVGDGDHRSATQFAEEVARLANIDPPRKIPWAQAQEEFSPLRLAFLSASRIVDTTKMQEVLGVTPRTPEDGIRDSL